MAFAETTISADEATAVSRDYPMLVGINVLERSQATPRWNDTGSWASGGDATASGGPGRLAYDRNGKTATYADIGSALLTELSIIFDVSPTTADAGTFDTAFILGHNFNLIPNLSGVYLEISDSSAFASAVTVAQWGVSPATITTSNRLSSVELLKSAGGTGARYSNVRYVRLRFTASSDFTTPIPSFAELWLGRRRQLTAFGNLSFPINPRKAGVIDLETDSGNRVRHKLHAGASDRAITWETGGGNLGTLSMAASFDSWIDDIDSGSKPFLYVENTSGLTTARKTYLMQLDPPEYVRTANLGPYDSEVELSMVELPRFVSSEG